MMRRATVLIGAACVCLLPLFWALLAAFGLQAQGRAWIGQLTWDNFGEMSIFEPAFMTEVAYSLFISATATAITIGAAYPAAYYLARTLSTRIDLLMQTLLVLSIIPAISYGLPLADVLRQIGLQNTFIGALLAYAGVNTPLALWVLRGYVRRIPHSIEEAAYLEGATWTGIMFRVALPAVMGGVVASAVLVFVLNWNSYLIPSLLAQQPPLVLPLAMRDFFAFERDLTWPTAAAVLTVSLLPPFILILLTQRALERFSVAP